MLCKYYLKNARRKKSGPQASNKVSGQGTSCGAYTKKKPHAETGDEGKEKVEK